MAENRAVQLPQGLTRSELANTLYTAITQAESDRRSFLTKVEKNRQRLRANTANRKKPWPGSASIHMRLIFWTRQVILAQIEAAIFGSHPYFTVRGKRRIDERYSKFMEEFCENLLTDVVPYQQTLDPIVQFALDDGVCGAHFYYDQELTQVKRRDVVDTFDEAGQWQGQTYAETWEEETAFDGPRVDAISIDRFGVIPSHAQNLQRAQGVYFLDDQTGNELLSLYQAGFIDKEALDVLQGAGDESQTTFAQHQKYLQNQRNLSFSQSPDETFHTRTFDVHKVFWRLQTDKSKPAQRYWIWFHHPTHTILHCEPWQAWSSKVPMVLFRPYPDAVGIYGDSLADIIGDVQETMSGILRQVLDQTSMDIHPPLAMDAGAKVPGQEYTYGPGQIWEMYGGPDKIRPITNPSQVNIGIGVLQFLLAMADKYTGGASSSEAMGLSTSSRETATEAATMDNNRSLLFNLILSRIHQSLNDLMEGLVDVCYEYLGNDGVMGIWEQIVPEGEDVASTAEAAMRGKYYYSASGTSDASSKSMRQTLMREVYERLLQNPLVASNPLRMFALTRMYLEAMNVRIPEELLGKEEEIKGAMAEQAQTQQSVLQQANAQAELPFGNEQSDQMVNGAIEQAMTQALPMPGEGAMYAAPQ